jgi:hypothetical protein
MGGEMREHMIKYRWQRTGEKRDKSIIERCYNYNHIILNY